ncbi:hypothetical protein HYQ46_002846 [Verticillium longisporum]|nr:hypothetical protein HYQ46_002846 [Verticillium longisporum]
MAYNRQNYTEKELQFVGLLDRIILRNKSVSTYPEVDLAARVPSPCRQQTFQDPCYGSAASQNGQTQISEDSTTDAIHPQGAVLDANNTAPKVLSLARVQHAMQQPSSGQNCDHRNKPACFFEP